MAFKKNWEIGFRASMRRAQREQTPTATLDATKTSSIANAFSSARQKMLARFTETDDWYKGDEPTESETLARIYALYQDDTQTGEQILSDFELSRDDPTSPVYSPYRAPTNQAVKALEALGFDMSQGVTPEWLEQNEGLKAYYRTGVNGTPLSPTSKSSPQEAAAYYYYKVLDAEDTTERAETEWQALQDEIAYWVGRKDRNYSDDEVLARIDWNNYKTLTQMDEGRLNGAPVTVNRAIGYSQDVLKGALWAARNGRSTGDPLMDSVNYVLGNGAVYQKDGTASARLDPTSETYNPYSVGSTIDDAALYFGASSFDETWLQSNRSALSGKDETALKYYKQVYDAEQNTKKAEQELSALREGLESWYKYTSDPDVILDGLLDDYPTLSKLDESLKSGDLVPTTRAIDFSRAELEREVREKCKAMNTAPQSGQYAASVLRDLGLEANPDATVAAINAARENAINAAGPGIKLDGTEEEKRVFETAYSADFSTYVKQISDAITAGTVDAKTGYAYSVDRVNQYAGEKYLSARATTADYDAAITARDAAQAQLDALVASGDPEAISAEKKTLEATIRDKQWYVLNNQKKYDAAKVELTRIQQGYAIADRVRALSGAEPADTTSALSLMDYAYLYGREYAPTKWSSQTTYQAALDSGSSYEEVAAAAQTQTAANDAEISRIAYVIEQLKTKNIKVDDDYIRNMERRKEALERDNADAVYFLLPSQAKDFESVATAYEQKINQAWEGNSVLAIFGPRDGVPYTDYLIANPDADRSANSQTRVMTDQERKTYYYLAATEGEDAAKEFYGHLFDPEYGAGTVRSSMEYQTYVQDFAKDNPVGSTLQSVLLSPYQTVGGLYAVGTAAVGGEINPYSPAFAGSQFVQGTRETVKQNITKGLGEGTFATSVANVGYDVVTGAGDSLLAGAMGGGNVLASVGLMASEAASSAIMDAKLRGSTDTQALLMGGATFVSEAVTEVLPLDALVKAFKAGTAKSIKALITNTAKSILTEAVGESVSQALETGADELIMQKASNRTLAIQTYIAQGLTEEAATEQANKDIVNDILYAGLVGGLSGGVTTAGGYLAGRILNNAPKTPLEGPPASGGEILAPPPGSGNPVGPVEAAGGSESLVARKVSALFSALNNPDVSNQTATLAGVLGANEEAVGTAAAQKLVERYGAETVLRSMQDILLTAAENGVADVESAIATVALGSDIGTLDALIGMNASSPETITAVMLAAEGVAGTKVNQAVHENQIALRFKDLIGDGALAGLRSYEVAQAQAKENLRKAEADAARARQEYNTAGQNAQSVNAQFITNPASPELRGAMQQAVHDLEGKVVVVRQMEAAKAKYASQVKEATATLDTMRNSTLKAVREQAQSEVLQERATRMAQQAVDSDAMIKTGMQTPTKVYYRGTVQGETKRISTGNATWDNNLFASKSRELASAYGNDIESITPKADAKILVEGSAEFKALGVRKNQTDSMLDWGARVVTAAKAAGYDIIEFARQGDVGTVILNPNSVIRNAQAENPVEVDGEGATLAPAQQKYFEGSKVRDAQGKLLPMYNGAQKNFTVFDHAFIGANSGSKLGGFWFSNKADTAANFAAKQLLKGYVDIKNPLSMDALTLTPDALAGFMNALGENVKTSVDFKSAERNAKTAESLLRQKGSDYDVVETFFRTVKDPAQYQAFFNTVKNALGFDGYISENGTESVAVVFSSEQFKTQENASPTANPDVRYARGEGADFWRSPVRDKANQKSNNQAILDLSNDLGVPIDTRRSTYKRALRKESKGYTTRGSGVAHVQDAQNLSTTAHELGHIFDTEFKLQASANMPELLSKLAAIPDEAALLSMYPAEQQPFEAIAEVVRAWMVDRDSAIELAGQPFVDALEKHLNDRKGPGGKTWLVAMREAADTFRANRSLSAAELAQQRIQLEERKPKETFAQFADRAAAGVFDYTKPLESLTRMRLQKGLTDMAHDPRTLLLRKESVTRSYTDVCMFDYIVGPEGFNQKLTDEGLFASFDGLTSKDEKPFNALWELLHARSIQNLETANGIVRRIYGPDIDVDAAIAQLQAEHPDYMERIEKFEKNYDIFMRAWLVDTGLLPAEVYEKMHADDPYYIPSFRVLDKGSGEYGQTALRDTASPGSGLRRASMAGSSADIYNPVMGLAEYVQRYISNYRNVEVLRAFTGTMREMGTFNGIAEPMQKDMERVNGIATKASMLDATEKAIQELSETGKITEESAQTIRDALADVSAESFFTKDTATGNDILNVPEADGSISSWTVYNTPMFAALAKQQTRNNVKVITAVARLTRALCSFATSRSPAFILHNFTSDSETAMLTGTQPFLRRLYPVFIAEQISTLGKTLYNTIADKVGGQTSEDYQRFKLEGKLGSRYTMRTEDVQKDIRRQLFKETGVARVGQIAKAVITSPIIAVEKLAGLLEDSTRFNEFINGAYRNDSSYAGDIMRGKGAREATVDFSKSGMWDDVRILGTFIPFLRANLEGVYKTARMFSRENAGNRVKTAAAIGVNCIFAGAMYALYRGLRYDKEEQEAYDSLTDYEKTRYYHFKIGEGEDAKFLRVKRSQDVVIQAADALGDFIGRVFTGYEADDLGALVGAGREILKGALVDITQTTFSPFTDAANNKTWYGGEIEDYKMQELPETARYEEDTPGVYRYMSLALGALGVNYSPLDLQYIVRQYTGSMGQTGTGVLSLGAAGDLTVENVLKVLSDQTLGKFVVDPAYSNNLTTAFYDDYAWLQQIVAEAKAGRAITYFRSDLTEQEMQEGLDTVAGYFAEGGELIGIRNAAKTLWSAYNNILSDDTLTNAEKEKQAREIRQEINETVIPGNAIIADFKAKYSYDSPTAQHIDNFLSLARGDKPEVSMPDALDKMPESFRADYDSGEAYMQQAYAVWQSTGKDGALPHPNDSFSLKGTVYEIGEADQAGWYEQYRIGYTAALAESAASWENMNDQERLDILLKAHENGHAMSKKWYMKLYRIK